MKEVKATLRKKLLQKRRSLSLKAWQYKSQQICDHLQAFPLFGEAKTILTYFSFRQEPDLSSLFALNKVWGVPRCVEKSLSWHVFPSDFPTQTGAYGMTEPHPEAPILTVDRVDLILVPCVACDLSGYRLGYGGGFYDRLFSSPHWADKPTIGIVFQFGLIEALAIDPWDRPLQFICTEAGIEFPG
ncbi:5-formyltetrahydrofolate cyclo-ligase [Phormidesmis priestleyi]